MTLEVSDCYQIAGFTKLSKRVPQSFYNLPGRGADVRRWPRLGVAGRELASANGSPLAFAGSFKLIKLKLVSLICNTTSGQLKMSNPQHSSGCGLRRAVGVWLYSIWIELKDLQ